jgi:UDP-galactopyranose mutase
MTDQKRVLVVGAGFAGGVVARELAEAGWKVLVIDKRNHIAGNAYDYINEHGIRVHKYGPHLWHGNSDAAQEWASRFTEWVPYKHWVEAMLPNGKMVPLPINRKTISTVFGGIPMSPEDMKSPESQIAAVEEFMAEKRIDIKPEDITNSREHVEASVGKELCELFFAPYTKKMWGMDLSDLPASVAARIPTKTDDDPFYFPKDKHQCLPAEGYTKMFERIFDHENITVKLNTSREELPQYARGGFVVSISEEWANASFDEVFTAEPIDTYYNCDLGELPWRSIKCHVFDVPLQKALSAPVVNFTHDGPFTRVTEWKQLPAHGGNPYWTTLTVEEPCDYRDNDMERYYPVKTSHEVDPNRELYKQYRARAKRDGIHFIGRCGRYVYTDMQPCVNSTLAQVRKFLAGEEMAEE